MTKQSKYKDPDYHKKYRLKNKEKLKAYDKEYYLKNKEKVKEHYRQHNKEYQLENKETIKEYKKNLYETNKQKALDMLGGKCVVCGTTENLQFNHIHPKDKEFTITGCLTHKWDKVEKELVKCNLLCLKHHMDETARQWKEGLL